MVVVVAMLHDLALVIEAKERHSCVGEFPSALRPGGPPLNRSPLTRRNRPTEPALDVLFRSELLSDTQGTKFGATLGFFEQRNDVGPPVGEPDARLPNRHAGVLPWEGPRNERKRNLPAALCIGPC
jgi:hypothetical protein